MEEVLQTKKYRQLLEAEKGKERDSSLELPEGILSCWSILEFDIQNWKVLSFLNPKFVVIC